MENKELEHVANIAGYWTEGVAKGLLITVVPVLVVGAAIGLAIFIMKLPLKMIGGVQ